MFSIYPLSLPLQPGFLPPLSLVTFLDCLSCLLLCLAFAILYILSSPSLVFNSWYICCSASPLAIATAFSYPYTLPCMLFLVHCLVDPFASFRRQSSCT